MFGKSEDSEDVIGIPDRLVCNYCQKCVGNKSDLLSHISDSHSDGVFHCQVCDERFCTVRELFLSHLAMHGIELAEEDVVSHEDQFGCSYAKCEARCELNFDSEEVGKHKDGCRCVHCGLTLQSVKLMKGQSTKKLTKLLGHVAETESDDNIYGSEHPFECKYCGVGFISAAALFKHSLYHRNNSLLTCNICSQAFHKAGELEKHLLVHENDRNYLCHLCGTTFNDKSALTRHTEGVHLSDSRFLRTCEKCGKMYKSQTHFKNHQLLHTGIRQFVCDKCGKSFFNAHSLNIHLRAHSEARPFQCHLCGHKFRWLKNLKAHSKIHNRDEGKKLGTEVQCSVCKKELSDKGKLKVHMQSHTGERPFSCASCEKQFRQKTSLDYHMKTVHGARMDFGCDICGKCFPCKQAHDNHRRLHTGERPYKCTACSKTFRSVNCLRSHTKIHLDIRPYSCSFCEKCFCKKSQLDCHVRIHTGEKPFMCEKCGRAFTQKWDMIKHKHRHE